MAKALKFMPHLVEKILSGEKTSTWRLFDDKDLQVGDELVFVNKETGKEFGKAKITALKTKTLKTLDDADLDENGYASEQEMIEHFRKYYGNKVNRDSEVKIINFEFYKV